METDKPLVSILMAVYKPNEKWLREQLISLNEQTYSNIELLVCDDCPESPADGKIFSECVTKFPFEIIRNEKNLGSNKAFQRLTMAGRGKYLSYCDQDDIWHTDKVERMVKVLEESGSPMVCSDLAIIDGKGRRIADSITKIRKRHVFCEGGGLAGYLLVRSFVTGCAMMMRADIARASVPFVDSLIHDQWLAINAALNGRIEVIREPLIDYRQHENNQTGILHGVTTKKDYYEVRIENMRRRIRDYKSRLSGVEEIRQVVCELEEFNEARSRYFYKHKHGDLKIMKNHRDFARQDVLIETVMPFVPDRLMKFLFKVIRKGNI